jgi:hypothetical protein
VDQPRGTADLYCFSGGDMSELALAGKAAPWNDGDVDIIKKQAELTALLPSPCVKGGRSWFFAFLWDPWLTSQLSSFLLCLLTILGAAGEGVKSWHLTELPESLLQFLISIARPSRFVAGLGYLWRVSKPVEFITWDVANLRARQRSQFSPFNDRNPNFPSCQTYCKSRPSVLSPQLLRLFRFPVSSKFAAASEFDLVSCLKLRIIAIVAFRASKDRFEDGQFIPGSRITHCYVYSHIYSYINVVIPTSGHVPLSRFVGCFVNLFFLS